MTPAELAHSLSSQGFEIVPADPATKRPLVKDWAGAGSSKDPEQVKAWWLQWPTAMVGLRTGRINGIVVVDIDKHGASDGFKTIKAFPDIKATDTTAVSTPGGGQHLYYSYPGELKSTQLGPGVDFLAEKRQVIAPGSRRADGKPYLYINGHDLSGLAPLPVSILAALKRSPAQKKLDSWSEKIRATAEGDRHRMVRDAC